MSPFWHFGQLVVCVDTNWLTPPQPDERFPAQGDVLTIGDIDPDQGFVRAFVNLLDGQIL